MIDRIFIAVLLLSVSGFVFCVIFLPLGNWGYRLTSAKTMETVNTVALFVFVVPLYFVLSILDGSENAFSHYEILLFQDGDSYERIAGFARRCPLVNYLSSLWLLGTIGFLAYYIWKYASFSKAMAVGRFEISGSVWAEKFEELKREKDVPDVRIEGSCRVSAPCTFGIKGRTILVPAGMINSFREEEIDFILQHEFYHVIHRDLLKKLLLLLLSSAHWFNPLFHLLRNSLSNWQEAANDEEVTKSFDESEKTKYKDLIVKVMEIEKRQDKKNVCLVRFTGNSMKNYKRRLLKVEGKDKMATIWGKAVVASVTVVSVLSGTIVAKAADAPVNQMFSKNVAVVESGMIEEVNEIEMLSIEGQDVRSTDSTKGFVEIDLHNTANTTYEIIYYGSEAAFAVRNDPAAPQHLHDLVDIKLKEHTKFSDGSCKTTYYEGLKCASCGKIWKGDVIGETTLKKCPH